jgi:hypothetical protein
MTTQEQLEAAVIQRRAQFFKEKECVLLELLQWQHPALHTNTCADRLSLLLLLCRCVAGH